MKSLILVVLWLSGTVGTGMGLDDARGGFHPWHLPAAMMWPLWMPGVFTYVAVMRAMTGERNADN